jgi:hypothetical protein
MAYGFLPVPVTLDLMPMFVEFAASVTMGQYVGIVILEWELGHGRLSCMEEGWLDVFSVIPPLARKFNKRRSMNMVFIQEMVFSWRLMILYLIIPCRASGPGSIL